MLPHSGSVDCQLRALSIRKLPRLRSAWTGRLGPDSSGTFGGALASGETAWTAHGGGAVTGSADARSKATGFRSSHMATPFLVESDLVLQHLKVQVHSFLHCLDTYTIDCIDSITESIQSMLTLYCHQQPHSLDTL